ncbi:MAG: rhodanese-like domain-containing protein [Pseudomonadota bacterium]
MKLIPPQAVKTHLSSNHELAFLDVREAGQYGESHPFFAINVPYSQLERLVPTLVPNREVMVVLIDGADGVAERAAKRMTAMGYRDVGIVTGGIAGWEGARYGLFKGVNVPSKTFGELVEHAFDTPRISASDLARRVANGDDLVILDGRTASEFSRMCIPGGVSCPNAELVARWQRFAPSPDTTVVINCAGRTRSIMGAENLRQLKIANPVVALENGTQGWQLAGFELDRDQPPVSLAPLSESERSDAISRARPLAQSLGIPLIDPDRLNAMREGPRTWYLLDVRTEEEFAQGHVSDARHAPGGQLVQSTDQWVAVRGAQIVLTDDVLLRAVISAHWLRGMGHDVAVLDGPAALYAETTAPAVAFPTATLTTIDAAQLPRALQNGTRVLDASPSMLFREAHLAPAQWINRANALSISPTPSVIVTGPEPTVAALLAIDLIELGVENIQFTPRDIPQWEAAGLDVIRNDGTLPDAECIDYLFFVHDRHSGNLDAARAYLAWETGLIGQLDEDERGALNPHGTA